MSPDVVWSILAIVVMLVGLAGIIIPVIPGLLVIWATALIYGFAVGWDAVGVTVMVLLTVIVIVSIVTGILLPKREADEAGASRLSQYGAIVGAIIGFFTIPVVGVFVGALIGILTVELLAKGNWDEAWTATIGLAKGLGLSVVIDLLLGMVMISAWSIWAATVLF